MFESIRSTARFALRRMMTEAKKIRMMKRISENSECDLSAQSCVLGKINSRHIMLAVVPNNTLGKDATNPTKMKSHK